MLSLVVLNFCWRMLMPFQFRGTSIQPRNTCLESRFTSFGIIGPGWWFGPFFIFPYIQNNHPKWLIFFRGVGTPPTRDLFDGRFGWIFHVSSRFWDSPPLGFPLHFPAHGEAVRFNTAEVSWVCQSGWMMWTNKYGIGRIGFMFSFVRDNLWWIWWNQACNEQFV